MDDNGAVSLAARSASPLPMVQPKPGADVMGVEIGVGMNLPFSVPFRDDHTVEILHSEGADEGPTPAQLKVMRRTDGQARALYRLITLPIRSAIKAATFAPADGGDKEAQFIENMFRLPPSAGGMTTSFSRVLSQMLLAVFDGFAAFEQVFWVPKSGPLKGKITLKKLAYRPTETVTFLADSTGGFAGLHQRAVFNGQSRDVDIPVERALYYAAQEEESPFYGVSFFQSAFYHYDKKVRLYYVAHLAAQRAAVSTRVGTEPASATDSQRREFRRALADLGLAQSITLPTPDFKVDSLPGGGTFDFLSLINHHNSQMSKSVLAAFFDANQGGGSSDTSLVNFGEQSDALFMLMLQSIMDELAAVINTHLIPKFIDWNFGTSKYPTFRWGAFTDEQKAEIQETFKTLATSGPSMNVTKEFFRALEKEQAEEMGLDIDWKEVEQREASEAQQAQAAAGALGGGGGFGGQAPGGPPAAPGGAPNDGWTPPADAPGPETDPSTWQFTSADDLLEAAIALVGAATPPEA